MKGTQLTERDVRLIAKCARARWLTTSQIRKLFFARASTDAVRKRLRKLAEGRHLLSCRSHRMVEALHAVGAKGARALRNRGMEVELEKSPPSQVEHLIGINDVRVVVETGGASPAYFFAAWELGKLGWHLPVVPDAVFAFGNGQARRTFAVEYDRGTETARQLVRKLRLYAEVPVDAVLILADTDKRLESLRRVFQKRSPIRKPLLGATIGGVRDKGMGFQEFIDLAAGGDGRREPSNRTARHGEGLVSNRKVPLFSGSPVEKRGLVLDSLGNSGLTQP